ncbi:MAG: fimbrillin family protein, partial [Rikenellaceae bacterium]
MKRAITILASAVALLVGCDRSGEGLESAADGVARFSSDISTRVSTDSAGVSTWEDGDEIGIYMYHLSALASNVPYAAQSSGAATTSFEAVGDDKILFPTTSDVQFIAYSPYSAEVVDEEITIDLSDQTTEAKRNALDLMVSADETGYSYKDSATSIPLVFSHKLAMVRFNVTAELPETTTVGLSCEITSGLTAIQSYDIPSGTATKTTSTQGAITMLDENGDGSLFTAIVHPETFSSAEVLFTTAEGDEFTGELTGKFVADNIYTYSVQVGEGVPEFAMGSISSWGNSESADLSAEYSLQDIRYDEAEGLYKIYTAVGLKAFATLVNDGTAAESDAKLMNNIDLSSVCSSELGDWTPIGSSYTITYNGTFDGGDYLVSGLYIRGSSDTQGLFGNVGSGGVVKSVGVSGEVSGEYFVGGVVGYNVSGSVTNCYNTAAVSGDYYVGGVVG